MTTKLAAWAPILFEGILQAQKNTTQTEKVAPPRLVRPSAEGHIVTGTAAHENLTVRGKLYAGEGKLIEQRDVFPGADDQGLVVGFKAALVTGSVVVASHLNGRKELDSSAPLVVSPATRQDTSTPENPKPQADAETPKQEPRTWTDCEAGTTESGLGTPGVRVDSGATKLSGQAILEKGKVTVCINQHLQQIADASANPSNFSIARASYEIRVRPCATTGARLKTSDSKPYVVAGENGDAQLTFEMPFHEGQ